MMTTEYFVTLIVFIMMMLVMTVVLIIPMTGHRILSFATRSLRAWFIQ